MGAVNKDISPAMWEAMIRRGMAYSRDGIMMLNRKGRRWFEKQIGKEARDGLRAQARGMKPADHWGEGKKLEEED